MFRWVNVIFQGVTDRVTGWNLGRPDNSTSIGLFNGFPFNEIWLRNVEGVLQAIRAAGTLGVIDPDADIPVSGVSDQVGASDIVEALDNRYGSPGEVVMVAAGLAYSVGNKRLLPLQGGSVRIDDYPDLDEAVYVGDANNAAKVGFYHSSNSGGGTADIAGPWLQLPDFRGRFMRVRDRGVGLDEDGDQVPGFEGAAGAPNSSGNFQSLHGEVSHNQAIVHSPENGFSGPYQGDITFYRAVLVDATANESDRYSVNLDDGDSSGMYGARATEVAPHAVIAGDLYIKF